MYLCRFYCLLGPPLGRRVGPVDNGAAVVRHKEEALARLGDARHGSVERRHHVGPGCSPDETICSHYNNIKVTIRIGKSAKSTIFREVIYRAIRPLSRKV